MDTKRSIAQILAATTAAKEATANAFVSHTGFLSGMTENRKFVKTLLITESRYLSEIQNLHPFPQKVLTPNT